MSFIKRILTQTSAVLYKGHGNGVEAISVSRGRWSVGKNMPQMAVAPGTTNLGTDHAVAVVMMTAYMVWIDRLKEAGPTRTGVKFCIGPEQRQFAQTANIHAGQFLIGQIAAKRWFSSLIE